MVERKTQRLITSAPLVTIKTSEPTLEKQRCEPDLRLVGPAQVKLVVPHKVYDFAVKKGATTYIVSRCAPFTYSVPETGVVRIESADAGTGVYGADDMYVTNA